jgi:NADH:ubiquinone oxidoreductase subunit E
MKKIEVCLGKACKMNKTDEIFTALKKNINQSTDKFELSKLDCFNNCRNGATVSFDNHLFSDLTVEDSLYIFHILKENNQEKILDIFSEARKLG